jgi:hypothetical protein
MENDDTNKFLAQISAISSKIPGYIEVINARLKSTGTPTIHRDCSGGYLRNYLNSNPSDRDLLIHVEQVVLAALQTSTAIDDFRTHKHAVWEGERFIVNFARKEELAHDKLKRRDERIDMWKLWGEQTARWVIGAALAVLLYSSVIWLSDRWGFFHVPTKDWFGDHKGIAKG